jgi:hypothetical protein
VDSGLSVVGMTAYLWVLCFRFALYSHFYL